MPSRPFRLGKALCFRRPPQASGQGRSTCSAPYRVQGDLLFHCPSLFKSISEPIQFNIRVWYRVCLSRYPSLFPCLSESAQDNNRVFSTQYPSLLKSLSESIQAVRSWPPLGLPAGQPNGPARRRCRLGRAALRLERRPRAAWPSQSAASGPDRPRCPGRFAPFPRPFAPDLRRKGGCGGDWRPSVCVRAACARVRACVRACVCVRVSVRVCVRACARPRPAAQGTG